MKDYKQYFTVSASPEEVYMALTNPFTIELWSGEKAIMSTEPGSEFSLWEDSITGINLDFEENKLLRQAWDFGGQEPASIVTIKLHTDKKGTSLELVHTNIPDEDYDQIVYGWKHYYIGSIIEFFKED